MKVLVFLGALLAVTFAVPTPESIRELFPGRTDLIDQVSSFGRLFARDAHRVYRKSLDGVEMNDLNAMLDQLVDGQGRLWDLLDRFTGDEESLDSDEEDGNPQEMLRDLISQLNVDPDSMSVLLSGEDRLEVDGKRLECMMEILDKLSKKFAYYLESLDGDRDMFGWRFIKRYLKSGLRVVLNVINSIKRIIQDAADELAIDEELEIPDEAFDSDSEEFLDFGDSEEILENTNAQEANADERTDRAAVDVEPVKLQEGARAKRSTVTAAFRSHNRLPHRLRPAPISANLGDYSSTPLGGGFSVSAAGLMWKNPKHRGHRRGY